jgi:hypothetical protein
MPVFFTVFSSEITAIKEAMTYILDAKDSQFSILHDTKNAALAIQD